MSGPARRPARTSLTTVAMLMGGNIRVGLEDNLYLSKGVLARSNAEQVAKAASVVRLLGRDIATPDEAREMLGLVRA